MEGLNGKYRARAVDMQLGVANTGTEQVAVGYELLDEPNAGMHVTWYGYFTDLTTERTMESLRISGWKSDDLTEKTGLGDREVQLVIGPSTYEGKTTTKVQYVNRPGGGIAMKNTMTPETAKSFAAKMKGHAIKSRSATPNNGSAPPAAAPQFDANGKRLPF